MKFFPKGAWGYALLLVVLFSLAAVATMSVVDLVNERFLLPGYERSVQDVSLAVWLLTMGFMFLAGALGLWGISATAEYESRHRIAKMVSAMNNLSDGLLAVDHQGRVRGANPAVRRLASRHFLPGKSISLAAIFPALAADDLKRLLSKKLPCEIELESVHSPSLDGEDPGLQMLRLRSQPVEGLNLIFVSDITEKHTASMQQHQVAKLQLLGRIAGGVAHDFSNILSAISGHAALMLRFGADQQRSLGDSINVIMNETQRGVRLSRQLLALSRSSDSGGRSSANLAESVGEAVELLRVALPADWKIESEAAGPFPAVSLSSAQIVQIVLNLGLFVADALRKPGRLAIQLKSPGQECLELPDRQRGAGRLAAVILISASDAPAAEVPEESFTKQTAAAGMIDTIGVIPSVVRTLGEEAGGSLDEIYAGGDRIVYRVCLPRQSLAFQPVLGVARLHPKTTQDMSRLNILLAAAGHKFRWLEKMLAGLGASVERRTAIAEVLGAIDSDRKPGIIIAEKTLFGSEANGLFRAIRKISPRTALVIISDRPEEEELQEAEGCVFMEPGADEEQWLNAVLRLQKFLKA